MTMMETALAASRKRETRASPLGLLIAIIAKAPRASEQQHREDFKRMVLEEGYEDFVADIIAEWQSIKYTTAVRAALPPSVEEIKKRTAERKERAVQDRSAVDAVKAVISARLLDMVTPNGKTLRDCTGSDCIRLGGFYTRIGKKIGARQIVGNKLSDDQLAALLSKR